MTEWANAKARGRERGQQSVAKERKREVEESECVCRQA